MGLEIGQAEGDSAAPSASAVMPGLAPLAAHELHSALAEERIGTLYQPIVRIADRQPLALEVLARLDHPAHGEMLPDLFVPGMENAGLAWPLTESVLRRAFADCRGGKLDGLDLLLSVNLPLDVLLHAEALRRLDSARKAAGIPATRIVLELTESREISDLARIAEAVRGLRAIGYGLAIDDVGPGIRDHTPLLDLDFTLLKLDKQAVQGALTDPGIQAFLVQAIAGAHAAGLAVIAEGVEQTENWTQMHGLGVTYAQGYLVGRPLSAEEAACWHRDWTWPG